MLSEAQRARKATPKVLQLDVPTRWLSAHEMLRVFLDLYDDLLGLALAGHLDDFTGAIPTLAEVRILRGLAKVRLSLFRPSTSHIVLAGT
jgi:hypothetical protein